MQQLRTPHEVSFPNDLLRTAFTTSVTGYGMGTAVGFIKAGVSLDAFFSGVLLRDAAIGAVTAAGLGVIWVAGVWAYQKYDQHRFREQYGYVNLDDDDSRDFEYTKAWYRPSVSSLNTWDVRVFLASQAVAVLAAVIFINTASEKEVLLGDYPGKSMGYLIGAIIGVFTPELIGRLILDRCVTNSINPIKPRFWFLESRHDVPFITRLFFAAWSAYAAYSIYDNSATDFNFNMKSYNKSRLMWTVLFSGIALLSPLFFAAVEKAWNWSQTKIEPNAFLKNLFYSSSFSMQDQRWDSESRIDMPWYVRLFCGVVTALTLGSVLATYHQTPFDKNAIYIYTAFTMASPFLFALCRKMFSCCSASDVEHEKSSVKLAYDMPWYVRVMVGSLAGMMLGQAIEYQTWDPETYYTNPPAPSDIPVVSAFLVMSLAVISPWLMSVLVYCGISHPIFNPVKEGDDDMHMPWYGNLLMGVWMGAVLGASFGNLFKLGDPSSVIPAYIGPEFLGLSNAVGATTGAFAGAGIGLMWSVFRWGWSKVDDADWENVNSFFSSMKSKFCCSDQRSSNSLVLQ